MAKSSIFESERGELIFNLADSRTNNKGYFRNLHVIFKFDIGISEKENIVRKHINKYYIEKEIVEQVEKSSYLQVGWWDILRRSSIR